MHHPTNPDRALRWARNTSAILAASIASLRIADVAGVIPLPEPLAVAAIAPFVASVIAAAGCGYRIKARRLERAKAAAEQRAQSAEWEAARLRREELLDDDADRELWDSIPAHPLDEDTCAFGLNVVALNQYRQTWGQQAG